MRKYNLPIFIPHRGCPHDCTFCSQRKITGVDTDITPEYVDERIEEYLETVSEEDSAIEVAFFGGSFTGLERANQEAFLKVANKFMPRISGVRLSTRPDYIDDEIVDMLKSYNVTTVELGVQSSNDEVLRMNNRGHSFEDVINASELIKKAGIALGHQMMVGMYGSDGRKDLQTAKDIIKLRPDCVRIYPVLVLKDTQLESLYNQGLYQPLTVMEAAKRTRGIVSDFRRHNIDVIRIGLHASEDLESEGNIVAGPYHQAFGEIVESLIYRRKIRFNMLMDGAEDVYEYVCKKGDISKAVGHKKMNTEYFREKYNITLKVTEERE